MPTRPNTHKPRRAKTRRLTAPTERWGRGRGGHKWRERRKRIFERDDYECQACKENGRLTIVTLHGRHHGVCDHKIPLSAGGSDDDSNLQCICQDCDTAKTQAESRQAG